MKPEILFEDEDIIVCVKPDGMSSQSDKALTQDMLGYLKTYLREQNPSEKDPYVAVVHRLDRPVGGVMVYAKNKAAAADLSEQVKKKTMIKYYQAVVTGRLPEEEGTFDDYLLREDDKRNNKSKVVKPGTKNAKEAILHYEVLDVVETDTGVLSYVLIELETGRHHQIRCQLAHHGAGLYGDRKYNPIYEEQEKKGHKQIGLIATRLEFEHPTTKEHVVFKTEPWGEAFDLMDAEEI